ncbi:hypothetical protein FCL47_18660 [Desulfopila sp. IMCC35006]|uniref:TolC family protein n=1 Tax=Desulfopila sp. IMCC35006 TaxID=2569542 RepID=UPI0010AC9A6A|nr:TolC family protein [Desulfopila sp. IMCC35006]TKB24503.1 hypothetical protein FCL47_18660 [Desulfopila sp. IMCC35006]
MTRVFCIACIRAIKKKLFLPVALVLVSPGLLFATEAATAHSVSLQEVLQNITKTDPSILEALKQYESVVAERSIATSEYYPTVGTKLSTGPERTKGVPTDDREENLLATSATLFARQNLYNGGKTTAFVKETDARIKAAAYEVLTVANKVYLDAAEAYINVVQAVELLQIAEENALTQERIMRQVREKTEAGFNRFSELYNSESRLVLAKASYISRQQDLNQALTVFHRQFGRLLRPEQFIKPEPAYQFPDSVQTAIDMALKRNPALKVAKYNIETRRHSYDKASSAYLPTVDFELQGQYRSDTGGEEGETTQAGAYLTLNYTFFDGGFREGNKAKEQQSIRKEYQRSYIERRNVNETIRLAWNIKEAEDYKQEYLRDHVLLSEKTLNAFKDEYSVGRRTLLDLLNMENEYTDAQISMSQTQFSHLTALYRMMQGTGVLLDEHDTGLRKVLNLPAKESEETVTYADLGDNRDQDQVLDVSDQCDNSEPHSSLKPYGCKEDNGKALGYPHIDGSQLAPYIAPTGFKASTKTN